MSIFIMFSAILAVTYAGLLPQPDPATGPSNLVSIQFRNILLL